MKIFLIAAISENRVIGKEGQIPWHLKADLIHFRDLTLRRTVIMGRKAFDSMFEYYQKAKKTLPERTHIVVTRDGEYDPNLSTPDATIFAKSGRILVAHSLENAFVQAKKLGENEVFVAGGGQIYSQAITFADKLYLTIVHENFDGDVFFPDYINFSRLVSQEDHEEDGVKFSFLELERESRKK